MLKICLKCKTTQPLGFDGAPCVNCHYSERLERFTKIDVEKMVVGNLRKEFEAHLRQLDDDMVTPCTGCGCEVCARLRADLSPIPLGIHLLVKRPTPPPTHPLTSPKKGKKK